MKIRSTLLIVTSIFAAVGIGYALPRNITQAKSPSIEAPKPEENHEEEKNVVEISESDARAAGIEVGKANFGTGSEIRIFGRVMASPEARTLVGAPISGRVARVYVSAGSRVNKGAALFEIISAEAAGVIGDARVATANLSVANANANASKSAYNADEWLYSKGVISKRDLENSRAAAISADANVAAQSAIASAARAKIGAAGFPSQNGAITIRAPISGIVSNMPVSVGGFVSQGAIAGEITNINNTEAVFQVAPTLLEHISLGSRMNVEASNGQQFDAVIVAIAPGIEAGANNSIVRAKIVGVNIAVGSVLGARVVTNSGNQTLKPIVPSDSIVSIGENQVVFVKTANGFIAVPIVVGSSFNGQTEIVSGLSGSEIIVIKNAFLLKSQLAKSELEHEH